MGSIYVFDMGEVRGAMLATVLGSVVHVAYEVDVKSWVQFIQPEYASRITTTSYEQYSDRRK